MSETRNDAVMERVANKVSVEGKAWLPCDLDGNPLPSVSDDIRALLARVPAEGVTAEPVAWMMERDTPRAHSLRFTCDETEAQHESRRGYQVTPLYARATPPAAVTGEPCDWHQDGDGLWQTDCGNAFVFIADGPWMNGMKFCGYCGKKLVEVPHEPMLDEDDDENEDAASRREGSA